MTTTYDVQLGPVYSRFGADLPWELREYLDAAMALEVKNARHTPQFRAGVWDGYQRFFAPATASFLTGLLSWVEELLAREGVEVRQLADRLPACEPRVPEPRARVTLRDYQEKTVTDAIRLRRGIIEAAVNAGKTSMGIEIIRRLRIPTVYVVPDKGLYAQALKSFREELPDIPLGELKASDFRPALVTVAMIQSLTRGLAAVGGSERIRSWIKTVECVIEDEVHHGGAKKFSLVFRRAVRAPYRYGLSATPLGMSEVRDRMLVGLIGPPFGKITVKDLEARGLSVPMEVRFVSYAQDVNALRAYSGRDYREIWTFGVKENADRAAAMYAALAPHVAARERVLIFVDQVQHGQSLARLTPRGVAAEQLYGMEAVGDRELIERAFRDGRAPLLISTLLKEGVNIPEIDVIVNASGRKSEWVVRQQGGRGVRLRAGKERVVLYDFIDAMHPVLLKHSHARHAAYKKEGYPITLVAPMEPEFAPIVT